MILCVQNMFLKLKEKDVEMEQLRATTQRDIAAMQKKLDDVWPRSHVCCIRCCHLLHVQLFHVYVLLMRLL